MSGCLFIKSKKFEYLVAVLFCLYFIRHCFLWFNGKLGPYDWDYSFFNLEAIVRIVRDFHQLPLWNPYQAGGLPVFENPQTKFFSPTFILGLLFGAENGLKMSVPFYYICGSMGTLFLFRSVLGFHPLAAIPGSAVFLFSGFLPLHIYAGHLTFIGACLLPLAIGFFIQSLQSVRRRLIYLFACGLVLTTIMSEGGIHLILFSLPGGLVAVLVATALFRKSLYLVHYLLLLLIFFLLSAYRLLPLLDYYLHAGFISTADHSSLNIWQLWEIFRSTNQSPLTIHWAGQVHNWWEYGNHIGLAPLIVVILCLPFIKKESLIPLAVCVMSLAFMLGKFSDYSPATLLAHLPGYGNQRCYGRWGILAVLSWSVFAAHLLNGFIKSLTNRPGHMECATKKFMGKEWRWDFGMIHRFFLISIALFVFVACYQLIRINSAHFKRIFVLTKPSAMQPVVTPATVRPLKYYGAASSLYPALLANLSTSPGYELLRRPEAVRTRQDTDYQGEFYLLSNGNRISPVFWSPALIRFEIYSNRRDLLIINQNYLPGWHTTTAAKLREYNKLLAVELQPGDNIFQLYYLPWSIPVGLFLSLMGVLIFLSLLLLLLHRR